MSLDKFTDEPFLSEELNKYELITGDNRISLAIEYIKKHHEGQFRESGEPYYYHPLEVAYIAIQMQLDSPSVVAALLHDVVEDTDSTLEDIKKNFGPEITKLVDGVTKLNQIEFFSKEIYQVKNLRKFFLAIHEDIRVLLIKLADRLHNIRTIEFIRSQERMRNIAKETLEIYAPLAGRFGMEQIKYELQDISFKVLHPEIRATILQEIKDLSDNQSNIIETIIQETKATIKNSNISGYTVEGRIKKPYSIWQKTEQKQVKVNQLSDIFGLRIIVQTKEDCYRVLGVMHMHYQMVPASFKDFISTPKDNLYQSLHTVVIGPEQRKIEVQIRTREMHKVSEFGVAAHWQYKHNSQELLNKQYYVLMKELLAIVHYTGEYDEFFRNVKTAVNYYQVNCFDKDGRMIYLPQGASIIDFAYALGNNIGNHCLKAKVNGVITPVDYLLQDGDQIEIITSKYYTPIPLWEKIAITSKARLEIRKFIENHKEEEYKKLGSAIFYSLLSKETSEIESKQLAMDIATSFNYISSDELFLALGSGSFSHFKIIKYLKNIDKQSKGYFLRRYFFFASKNKKLLKSGDIEIAIGSLENSSAVNFAECCYPAAPEKILGVMIPGRGMVVHKDNCSSLENYKIIEDKLISLNWQGEEIKTGTKIFKLDIVAMNKTGIFIHIQELISSEETIILSCSLVNRSSSKVYMSLVLESILPPDNLIFYLKNIKDILSVTEIESKEK